MFVGVLPVVQCVVWRLLYRSGPQLRALNGMAATTDRNAAWAKDHVPMTRPTVPGSYSGEATSDPYAPVGGVIAHAVDGQFIYNSKSASSPRLIPASSIREKC